MPAALPSFTTMWLQTASVMSVRRPVDCASLMVVKGLLKYENVLQPCSQGPQ